MEENQKTKIKALLSYDAVVLAILAVVIAGTLALKLTNMMLPDSIKIPYCLSHDILHLYCPFCGCTRAGLALLKLDFISSFKANPLVLVFIFGFVLFNLISYVRIKRGKDILRINRAGLYAGIILTGFALIRNILMMFFDFDTLGELVSFWSFI